MSSGAVLADVAFNAQARVLGPMLVEPSVVGEVLLAVSDSEFTEGRYRLIYQAIRKLYNEGKPVDGLTVNDALGGNYNELLAEIINQTVTATNVMEYVAILKRSALQMHLAELGGKLAEAGDLDASLALVDAINALNCGKTGVRITTLQQAYTEFLDRHADGNEAPYLRWGISALDEKVHVEAGDLVVLGGYPSAGKTALALQFARYIAKDHRVGYFYLENNDKKLFDRVVSATTMVSFAKIKTHKLGEDDFRAIIGMQEQLTAPQLEFVGASGMTVSDIRSIALAKHYDLIVVDYLQKIRGDRSRRNMSDFERVTQISSDLQELGQQTGIHVLALSQLSRPEKKNGKTPAPTMASLRQSGQIEQDADVIMLVYAEDDSRPRLRTLKLAKNKEGQANIAMRMVFEGDTQTFSRIEPQEPPTSHQRQKPLQQSFWGDGSDWQQIPDEQTPFDEEAKKA